MTLLLFLFLRFADPYPSPGFYREGEAPRRPRSSLYIMVPPSTFFPHPIREVGFRYFRSPQESLLRRPSLVKRLSPPFLSLSCIEGLVFDLQAGLLYSDVTRSSTRLQSRREIVPVSLLLFARREVLGRGQASLFCFITGGDSRTI